MNPYIRKFATVVLVLTIVSSGIMPMGLSPIGESEAIHDCSSVDALAYGFSLGYVNEDKCTNNHVEQAVEEVRDAETSQDKVDIYSSASAQKEQSRNFEVVYDNYLQDTESVAWMKAEAAIARAYENGSTKAEAKVAAKEAIADYYAKKQINLYRSWNTHLQSFKYLNQRAKQEGFTGFVHNETDTNYNSWSTGPNVLAIESHNVTLVNGTNQTQNGFRLSGESGTDVGLGDSAYVTPATKKNYSVYDYSTGDKKSVWFEINSVNVSAPNSNYDELNYMEIQPYMDRWKEIEAKNDNLQNESDAFVDATWQDYQDGNINSTDVLNRNTIMFEYGTSAQGNGSYYDVIGATAAMGLSTPNMTNAGTMEITIPDANNTYEGMVFARNPPNNQWEVGKTYNPDNISGPVMLGTTSGNMFEVKRNFTIDSATTKDGTSQSTVNTTNYNYKTANTTELQAKYDKLLKLTQELQERSETADGDSTSDGGSGSDSTNWQDELFAKYFGIPLIGWGLASMLVMWLFAKTGSN
jgi:hypothetical protein